MRISKIKILPFKQILKEFNKAKAIKLIIRRSNSFSTQDIIHREAMHHQLQYGKLNPSVWEIFYLNVKNIWKLR